MIDFAWPVLGLSGTSLILTVVALLVAGFILLGLEFFVIPGFGIVGVLGVASLVGGAILSWANYGPMWGIIALLGSLGLAVVLVVIFAKTRAGKRFVLSDTLASAVAVSDEDKRLLGRSGVAHTMLRPSGIGQFGDERVEVETEGEYIARGTPIRVVNIQLGRVVVEEAGEAPQNESEPV
jgi:membrane-bound serine protease (ClpP class)